MLEDLDQSGGCPCDQDGGTDGSCDDRHHGGSVRSGLADGLFPANAGVTIYLSNFLGHFILKGRFFDAEKIREALILLASRYI